MRFEHLALEDGLSQNSVLAMLQDSQGFLWFGAQDGLSRCDGYSFTVFKNDPADPNSLSINSILAQYEDDDGALWIGTWGGGLNRFDPRNNLWTLFRRNDANPVALCGDVVTTLLESKDGALWVGTNDGGLCRLDCAALTFTHYRHAQAIRSRRRFEPGQRPHPLDSGGGRWQDVGRHGGFSAPIEHAP